MATKQFGTVLFSNIVTQPSFNGAPTGKYELTVTLTEEQAADAETNGVSIQRSDYNGQTQCKAKFKTKFQPAKGTVVDRYKNPYVDDSGNLKEIPRGSEVCVHCDMKPYEMMGKKGVTNYLRAIQIVSENSGVEFDDYSEELDLSDGEDSGEY